MADSEIAETATAELRASQELNQRIIDALPGGLVHVSAEGAILTANPEALRLLGLSQDKLTGLYTQDFATETLDESGEPCPVEDYPVTRALVTGEPQPPATIGVRKPDGEVSWAIFTAVPVKSPTGETTGAVVTFLDVTQSKHTMSALRESEARLRSVVDSAPSTILTSDTKGKVLFANRSDMGVSVGQSVFDLVGEDQQGGVRDCIDRVLESRKIGSYEISLESNGRDYSVRVGPVEADNSVVALSHVATDVTEMKALQEHVAVSDRLASIGTLAVGVAHEINNPLTYLLLSLEMARKSAAKQEATPLLRSLDIVKDAAERIRAIVGELGAFGRTASDELELVDLEAVVDSALTMAANQTRYRARIIRDYRAIAPVLSNGARLSQVILNLLVNAAQAIEEGDVENNSIAVTIAPETETGRVNITIADTGRGIARELLPRIFEPFVTTKEVGEGTGLGLHICHNIIETLAGSIRVKSTVGAGTSFVISLPTARDVVATTTRVPKTPEVATTLSTGKSLLRILVIDDEETIRDSFGQALSHHAITLAASGREGIQVLKSDTFDIVFCDLIMPDMTGMDVYEFVQEKRPALTSRLVFMTGGAFTKRADDFLTNFDLRVLKKPFDWADVETHLQATDAS